MLKVACFSVACVDSYPQFSLRFPGGNALNQSVRFRELGCETLFAGAVGGDEAGERIGELLRAHGVDRSAFHFLMAEKTASNQLVVDAQGERSGLPRAWSGGAYERYRMSEEDWDHILSCPVWSTHFNAPDFAEAIQRKPANTKLFVDFLHLPEWEPLERTIANIDIAYIGGELVQMDRLLALSRESPDALIVLTLGAGGSVAMKGGRSWRQDALPLDRVVDTTGCGDAFQSSCSVEWMRSGDIASALRAGAEGGRQCAGRLGALPWGDA